MFDYEPEVPQNWTIDINLCNMTQGAIMDDNEDTSYSKLVDYVNAASDLAESLEMDIIVGKTVSDKTVVKLSRFVLAADKFRIITDTLKQLN